MNVVVLVNLYGGASTSSSTTTVVNLSELILHQVFTFDLTNKMLMHVNKNVV